MRAALNVLKVFIQKNSSSMIFFLAFDIFCVVVVVSAFTFTFVKIVYDIVVEFYAKLKNIFLSLCRVHRRYPL
jgi:hypothetical protein